MNNSTKTSPSWARWILVGVVLVTTMIFLWKRGANSSGDPVATFKVRKGPLDITVLEGGSIHALNSQEIKCEVRVGYQGTKILKIVEEGYLVTNEDVTNGKVLVELDSSEITKQITQQEIQYETSLASLTDAQQGYEIQQNQNQSDIKAAEQKVRFSRLDLDKFIGTEVSDRVLKEVKVEPLPVPTNAAFEVHEANNKGADVPLEKAPNPSPGAAQVIQSQATPAPTRPPADAIDFERFAKLEALGDGEAKQKLRKFIDDHLVAQKELEQSQATLEGTRRLFSGGFVTKNDLQRDEIAFENSRLKVQTSGTARDLFLKYEFIKTAEESLSKHVEALRELERGRKASAAKLAQAEAKLKSSQAQYNVQSRQRSDLKEQLSKCEIKATKPGLVVYGAGGDEMFYYGGEERIREGATVRERQAIITIPDLTRMIMKVGIHESYIKKIKKGLTARITVDAFPDKVLTGAVSKVGVLPDSQNRWMSPDLKVYLTTILIDGSQDWLKPGMTAKGQVMVQRLENVVHIPVQAVIPSRGKQQCKVVRDGRSELRDIDVGEFNDEFIEVKSGLKEGEEVALKSGSSNSTLQKCQ